MVTKIQVLSYLKVMQHGKIIFCEIWGLWAFLEEKKICMYFSVTVTSFVLWKVHLEAIFF